MKEQTEQNVVQDEKCRPQIKPRTCTMHTSLAWCLWATSFSCPLSSYYSQTLKQAYLKTNILMKTNKLKSKHGIVITFYDTIQNIVQSCDNMILLFDPVHIWVTDFFTFISNDLLKITITDSK